MEAHRSDRLGSTALAVPERMVAQSGIPHCHRTLEQAVHKPGHRSTTSRVVEARSSDPPHEAGLRMFRARTSHARTVQAQITPPHGAQASLLPLPVALRRHRTNCSLQLIRTAEELPPVRATPESVVVAATVSVVVCPGQVGSCVSESCLRLVSASKQQCLAVLHHSLPFTRLPEFPLEFVPRQSEA